MALSACDAWGKDTVVLRLDHADSMQSKATDMAMDEVVVELDVDEEIEEVDSDVGDEQLDDEEEASLAQQGVSSQPTVDLLEFFKMGCRGERTGSCRVFHDKDGEPIALCGAHHYACALIAARTVRTWPLLACALVSLEDAASSVLVRRSRRAPCRFYCRRVSSHISFAKDAQNG